MTPSAHPFELWPGLKDQAVTLPLPRRGFNLSGYLGGDPSAPPMLLIHGLGDEADTWRHLFHPLAQEHRLLAPSLPGFGLSEHPGGPASIVFYQQTLLELLDSLGIERAAIIGHSLGALIAHNLALEHPERVTRLVLIGGSLVAKVQKLDPVTAMFLVPGLGEWLYTRLRRDPAAAFRTLQPYYHDLAALPEADRQFLQQRVNARVWSDRQRTAFLSTLRSLVRWLPGQQRDLSARLARVTIPTTAIWGASDQINSVENGQALAEAQPGVRLVLIDAGGHNVHQEKPGEVLTAIRQIP